MTNKDEIETRSDGRVFITFVTEILGYLFTEEFNGYQAMDEEQYWRSAFTRVSRAKEDIHHRPSKHTKYGDARFNEAVWDYLGPCNDRQKHYQPQWGRLQTKLDAYPHTEYSETVWTTPPRSPRAVEPVATAAASAGGDGVEKA